MNRCRAVVGILLFCSASLFAQRAATGTVTGSVISASTKRPMEFANVVLYKKIDSTLVKGTMSGDDGKFTLKCHPGGGIFYQMQFRRL